MRPDLSSLRRRLSAEGGRALWRSLDELAETPEFLEFLHHEFPRQAAGLVAAVDRRQFLRLMAASLAFAGLGACTRQPDEQILPYVRQPEDLVAGRPRSRATRSTPRASARRTPGPRRPFSGSTTPTARRW
jgi:MoCo/4Fe-4S cofactor protein with predicted Tat translocation signal